MKELRLLCWNVNGIRAAYRKDLGGLLRQDGADIICLQETKATPEQLPDELRNLPGYYSYYVSPEEKKGYSGVCTYSKVRPNKITPGFGQKRFDSEGRTLVAHFDDFVLFNIYFPNGKASPERLRYKMEFYQEFLEVAKATVEGGKHVIICGDVNTAHKEIDLARPKENGKISGFLPQERAYFDRFFGPAGEPVEGVDGSVAPGLGWVDVGRRWAGEVDGPYTWWSNRGQAFDTDTGWRIDYHVATPALADTVTAYSVDRAAAYDQRWSDHAPVVVDYDV